MEVNMMYKAGIYAIRNLINGKVYVGQSSDLQLRKQQHFQGLEKANHHNRIFQAAYDK